MQTSPLPPPAILFDCDGTLLLTSDLHFRAISATIAQHGGQMPRDWYMGLTGLGRRDLFARFAADFGVTVDIERIAADSIARTATMAVEARENPPVTALARKATGRLPIAVVTNSEALIVRALLRETGLHDLFDDILSCEDAPRPKPAPDLYLAAAARLGMDPARCLVVEDSDQGITAAGLARMAWVDVRVTNWQMRCDALLRSFGAILA